MKLIRIILKLKKYFDYYNIYRHTQPFDGSDVASLLIASNVIDQSYEDKTALSGTHYYYRIEAVVEQTAEEQGVVSMSDEMVDAIKPIPLSAPYNLIVSVSDIWVRKPLFRI